MNGRFGNLNNNYTCIRSNGNSVVDYVACDYQTLKSCKSFKILTPDDLMCNPNVCQHLSGKSRMPDHALLHVILESRNYDMPQDIFIDSNDHVKRCYDYKKFKPELFHNDNWTRSMITLIDRLHSQALNKTALEYWYDSFIHTVFTELEKNMSFHDTGKDEMRKFKYYKP